MDQTLTSEGDVRLATAQLPSTSGALANPLELGVFGYDLADVLGAGDLARVLVSAARRRRAVRLIRHAGFRVRKSTPPLTALPQAEVEMALALPGVVVWRSHDPEVAYRWFWLHR
ncbi:MAG: hypothetical protein HYR62_04165 [Actinobacteria bacterium]|nr:hypothetical protein [Actinomycetota bacterium]MBI3686604.1 hypothetical protein [Actinomycetota bacterium]